MTSVRRFLWAIAAVLLASQARAADVKIPLNVIDAGWKTAKCEVELKDEEREGLELGGGVALVEVYCWRAAYQAGSIFFAVDPKAPDKARLLKFQTWAGKSKPLTTTYSLTSPDYNPKTRTLAMAHKGRGMGDCGETGEWKWRGKDFVLAGFWSKPNCDGKPFEEGKRWRVYPPK
jgi:hypothetical protein